MVAGLAAPGVGGTGPPTDNCGAQARELAYERVGCRGPVKLVADDGRTESGCNQVGPPYLAGATTLPAALVRGTYRALVQALWDEAVLRGTPALIVQARMDARPILERLGFRGGPPIHVLVDHSGVAQPPDASR
jgi:hypothetical protein